MSVGSAFSKERPSANQWHRRASDVSWESSWSLRCLQGSSKTGSSERHELKVDCCSLSVSWVYECSFFLKTFHEKAVCFSLCISTPAFLVLSVQKKALHLHWPLVAESFSTACFLTESKQLPEVLMFHILVLYLSFSFFLKRKVSAVVLTGLFEQRVDQYLEELPDTEQSGVNKFLRGLGEFRSRHILGAGKL